MRQMRRAGYEGRQICEITNHRDPNSLIHYDGASDMSEKFEKAGAILKIKPSVAKRITTTITSSQVKNVVPLLEALPGPSSSKAIPSPVKFSSGINHTKSTSSVGIADGNGIEKVASSVSEEILWEGNAEDIPDIASIVKTTNSKVRGHSITT